MTSSGDSLITLASHAEHELLLAAPFIKQTALRRVLDAVPGHVEVLCVTRWEPVEILAGVSDLEVWDILKERPLTELRLRMSLHAKFYRTGRQCLVGSANLTCAALGWGQQPNLELLVPVEASVPEIAEFERQLLAEAVIVDQSIYEATRHAVDAMREAGIAFPVPAVSAETESINNIEGWVPSCRAPDRLFDAYRGRSDRMLSSAFEDARQDLAVLDPPPELSRSAFNAYIISLLEQHPLIRKIDNFVSIPRTSGEIAGYLARNIRSSAKRRESLTETWNIIKLWLLTFFPDRYRIKPPDSVEVFVRGRQLR